jgi:hypothetical protein
MRCVVCFCMLSVLCDRSAQDSEKRMLILSLRYHLMIGMPRISLSSLPGPPLRRHASLEY